jgi:hypothetical protein
VSSRRERSIMSGPSCIGKDHERERVKSLKASSNSRCASSDAHARLGNAPEVQPEVQPEVKWAIRLESVHAFRFENGGRMSHTSTGNGNVVPCSKQLQFRKSRPNQNDQINLLLCNRRRSVCLCKRHDHSRSSEN